jgi:hypothetical protein
MTDTDLAWIAGLLEGEGSFLMPPPSKPMSALISMESTDHDVVLRAAALLGINNIFSRVRGSNKRTYIIRVAGARAEEYMRQLLPHMGERRAEKIRSILEYMARYRCCKDKQKAGNL